MDALQAVATSIGVIGVILLMLLLVLHFFGLKTTAWISLNREEKTRFSKNRIYNADGYLVSFPVYLLSNPCGNLRFERKAKLTSDKRYIRIK